MTPEREREREREGRLAELVKRGEIGFVHSQQVGSAVDGPGLRTVFWLSGCVMRCQYCHNPDTWKLRTGRPRRAEDLVSEALAYEAFAKRSGGGLTLSGGEPLLQHAFAARVLRLAHERGIHTALDTNGYFGARLSDAQLEQVDLVLLDLKSYDATTHRQLTGVEREPVLEFAERLASLGKRVWIRFVLVPGLTDDPENVTGIARFSAALGNVERLEVLPFHQLARGKWQTLGRSYSLEHVAPPSAEALARARQTFRAHGLFCPG